jgi:S1-C subfamily serine protease
VAIGNALDLGATPTVTQGIVSALNRDISGEGESLNGLIQTDAAINPGNSGGPLVDAQGRVVGMDTAIAGDAQNIGFALPIDSVKPVIDRIRAQAGRS